MICESCAARERNRSSAPGRSAALLLRVWFEAGSGAPRARLLSASTGGEQVVVATAQGVDDICGAVRSWLTRQPA